MNKTPFREWWEALGGGFSARRDCDRAWNAALEWAAGQFTGESRFGFEADLPQIRADILAGKEPEK